MRNTLKPRNSHGRNYTPTGVRRFFFKLELLGKRSSNPFHNTGNLDPVVDTPPEKAQPPSFSAHSSPGKENTSQSPNQSKSPVFSRARLDRVALLNEDAAESAMVITTFDDIPFCCHEDLITMSQERLVEVATSLNTKLPSVLAIDINHSLPANLLRQSIERIVGLPGDVPKAPKAPRLMTDSECNRRLPAEIDMRAEIFKTPPTSPLASRSRIQGQPSSLISPRLARLEEEDESEIDTFKADRALKRQKLSFSRVDSEDEDDCDVFMGPEHTPTPLPGLRRALSNPSAQSVSSVPVRILRSQSQRVERSTIIDTAFLGDNRTRPRYKARQASADVKLRQPSLIPKPMGAPRRSGRLRPTTNYQTFAPLNYGDNSSSSQFSTAKGSYSASSAVIGVKRKRGVDGAEAERQMMCGIKRMNMTGTVSDMDVGS